MQINVLQSEFHYIAYKINPVPKPRMTQRDKWKQRQCVMRYRSFKDECRLNKIQVPENGSHIVFVLPMPKSWPKKKRQEMKYQPHQQKPDIDNLQKALLDALFEEDEHIWDIRASKVWGEVGYVIIGKKV